MRIDLWMIRFYSKNPYCVAASYSFVKSENSWLLLYWPILPSETHLAKYLSTPWQAEVMFRCVKETWQKCLVILYMNEVIYLTESRSHWNCCSEHHLFDLFLVENFLFIRTFDKKLWVVVGILESMIITFSSEQW